MSIIKNHKWFFILTSGGIVIRLIALIFLGKYPLISDAASYHSVALAIVQGGPADFYWPPGLPFYLSLFLSSFGKYEIVSRSALLLIYLFFNFVAYLAISENFGKRYALLFLFVFAIYPGYIYHSINPLTQLPTALYLLSIYFLLTTKKLNIFIRSSLIGIAALLLVLTRPSSLSVLLFLPLLFWFITRSWHSTLLVIAIPLLGICTWMYHAYNVTGHVVPINYANSKNLFYGNNEFTPVYKTWLLGSKHSPPDVPEEWVALKAKLESIPNPQRNTEYLNRAVEHITAQPFLFIYRTLNRVRVFFAFDTYTGSILLKGYGFSKYSALPPLMLDAAIYLSLFVSCIFLIIAGPGEFRSPTYYVPVILVVLYSLPYFISFSHPTYHFPVTAFYAIFASLYIVDVFHKEKKIITNKPVYYIIFIVITLYIQAEWIYAMLPSL